LADLTNELKLKDRDFLSLKKDLGSKDDLIETLRKELEYH
jgi:hypothetical protein